MHLGFKCAVTCLVLRPYWDISSALFVSSYHFSMKRFTSVTPSPTLSSCCRYASPTPIPLSRRIHTSNSRTANPLPVTATGPPPPAPVPAASQYGERVDRRRRQAELLKRGQDMRASHMKPGTATKKRFWKDVSVQTDDGMPILFSTVVSFGSLFWLGFC